MIRATLPSASPRRVLGVQALLEWAFGREMAQIEWPDGVPVEERAGGFGIEYVLLRQAQLGCRVDGGGRSFPHTDADVVAAVLAGLPREHGGRRVAVLVAELARAGLTINWLPGAVPRCVPRAWKQTKHGMRAESIAIGRERVRRRGRWREVEIRMCPITYEPHPSQIEGARRAYSEWRTALDWLRETLVAGKVLTDYQVSDAMPRRTPWAPIAR